MLQQLASELCKLNIDNQANDEELEQYWRRFYLRIEGIRLKKNETSQ